MKVLKLLFILIILIFNMLMAEEKRYKNIFRDIEPYKAVEEMNPGWNLGNSLDAIPDETSWGNPKTEPYIFEDIKKAGFNGVRIPVTWIDHVDSNFNVYKDWMDRVEEVVNYALEKDLYVIINVHHDSWRWLSKEMRQNKEKTIGKLEKLWLQISERFKNYSEKLIFEIINEPQYEGFQEWEEGEIQNEVNERILKIIRKSGGFNDKRLVVVPPLSTDIYKGIKYFRPPKDPNIIIGIHYYSPWDFVANWWGRKSWGSFEDIAQMEKDFKAFYDKFKDYAIIVGEYGVSNGNRPSEWLYFDNLIRITRKYKMATFYWDNGFDNFDRRRRIWRDEMKIRIIMNGVKDIPNSFLNPGILFIRGDTLIKDETVNLILNGNQLVDIIYQGKALNKGRDYVLDNDKVILKSDFLKSIKGELGSSLVLTFRFNRGADYDLEVIFYKNPVLLDKPLVVLKGLSVPINFLIAFNGTRLCAIKLIREDNGKPVRDSWTPYLRGWDDFEVKDSQVIIKKHVVEKIDGNVKVIFEFFPENISLETSLRVK
ncbi:MAG: cellulase family glycosylhydrolase [Dictyoglomus sp.]|nr:cellulase family glycosylhydrolase [Dictyoglomus sp.]MDW8188230.1 cellulase family glycosylhydrolase [Dictyoglomus sp.]